MILAALLASLVAHAGEPSPYTFDPVLDVAALVLLAGATVGGSTYIDSRLEPRCTTACDLDKVPAFDRGVVGNHSETARTVSNFSNFGLVGLPYALAIGNQVVTRPPDGWGGTATDLVVVTQTVLTSTSVYMMAAIAARRPRPLAYDPASPVDVLEDPGNHISFFSGHTSTSFAMAVVASQLYALRHPGSPAVGPLWAGSLFVAAATGWMRTAAGRHFYSDVLAGALVGVAIGLIVPALHRRRPKGPQVSLAPAWMPDGAGLTLTLR